MDGWMDKWKATTIERVIAISHIHSSKCKARKEERHKERKILLLPN